MVEASITVSYEFMRSFVDDKFATTFSKLELSLTIFNFIEEVA